MEGLTGVLTGRVQTGPCCPGLWWPRPSCFSPQGPWNPGQPSCLSCPIVGLPKFCGLDWPSLPFPASYPGPLLCLLCPQSSAHSPPMTSHGCLSSLSWHFQPSQSKGYPWFCPMCPLQHCPPSFTVSMQPLSILLQDCSEVTTSMQPTLISSPLPKYSSPSYRFSPPPTIYFIHPPLLKLHHTPGLGAMSSPLWAPRAKKWRRGA